MARDIALSVACLIAALVCVWNAIAHDTFSLWDAGYYLAALGALLCLGRMFRKIRAG